MKYFLFSSFLLICSVQLTIYFKYITVPIDLTEAAKVMNKFYIRLIALQISDDYIQASVDEYIQFLTSYKVFFH